MRKLMALTAVAALAACATSSATPNETPATPSAGTTTGAAGGAPATVSTATWTATINAMGGSGITGSAMVRPSGSTEAATVSITGAPPNSTLPWHVHSGTCATGGGVVGAGSAYTPLAVGADGKATASATITASLDTGAQYHVNIHKSESDMGTIVACGDLTAGSM
jgi:hypothetical protein